MAETLATEMCLVELSSLLKYRRRSCNRTACCVEAVRKAAEAENLLCMDSKAGGRGLPGGGYVSFISCS